MAEARRPTTCQVLYGASPEPQHLLNLQAICMNLSLRIDAVVPPETASEGFRITQRLLTASGLRLEPSPSPRAAP